MKVLFQKLLVSLAIMLFAAPALTLGADNMDMELLAEKIKADKKLLVGINMSLTNEESKGFWPLYDAYQKELQSVNSDLGKLIVEFSEAYAKGPIANDTAKQIRNDVLALEEKELRLKRTNADKMDKVLPAWKVMRYMQIESKIRALVRFELAQRIPLTY